jgi:hypothetical protein
MAPIRPPSWRGLALLEFSSLLLCAALAGAVARVAETTSAETHRRAPVLHRPCMRETSPRCWDAYRGRSAPVTRLRYVTLRRLRSFHCVCAAAADAENLFKFVETELPVGERVTIDGQPACGGCPTNLARAVAARGRWSAGSSPI